jgi:hypothetical protein
MTRKQTEYGSVRLPPPDQQSVHITLEGRHFVVFDDGGMIERRTIRSTGRRAFGHGTHMPVNDPVKDPDLRERLRAEAVKQGLNFREE